MSGLVSVIIPVYNVEKFLKRCLDSVCNQTYKNIEIIIVNDGSPDNSQMIIDEYAKKDTRIVPIIQENGGLSEARNSGMRVANGKYLLFVDSDDYIELNSIELLIDNVNKKKADIVIANKKTLNPNGEFSYGVDFQTKVLNENEMGTSKLKFDYFLGRGYGVSACAKLYNHDFIKNRKIKFEKNNEIFAEDMLFNLKCYTYSPRISLMNEKLYIYCTNEDSITMTYKPNIAKRMLALVENFYRHLLKLDQLEQHQDLLDFMSFNAMSVSCANAYQYSEDRYLEIRKEIKYLMKSELIRQMIDDFTKGRYISDINSKSWRLFAWLYTLMLKNNLINLAIQMQLLRFKLRSKETSK